MKDKRILLKKEDGNLSINYFTLLFMIIVVIILMLGVYKKRLIFEEKTNIEDSLVLSNLATLIVDTENYYNSALELKNANIENYMDYATLFINPGTAYAEFKKSLKINLNLTDTWDYSYTGLITHINLESFVVYNVRTRCENNEIYRDVIISSYNSEGSLSENTVLNGANNEIVTAPNGKVIKESCCYSKIGFEIRGLYDDKHYKTQDNIVEFKRNENGYYIN